MGNDRRGVRVGYLEAFVGCATSRLQVVGLYGQTLFAPIRRLNCTLRPDLRRASLGRAAEGRPQWGFQEGRQPQARHELPPSRLQEPIEGPAVPIPLRGASQAADE